MEDRVYQTYCFYGKFSTYTNDLNEVITHWVITWTGYHDTLRLDPYFLVPILNLPTSISSNNFEWKYVYTVVLLEGIYYPSSTLGKYSQFLSLFSLPLAFYITRSLGYVSKYSTKCSIFHQILRTITNVWNSS